MQAEATRLIPQKLTKKQSFQLHNDVIMIKED